ncbi:hypothetical protein DPMN_087006 [Dreissena polymorpha]|uniref:Uncharacterized protein n=1 Tax=Dreissena polymorpha TaxID=45954 RepID=A0A9D4KSF6_DREPO|nr:hypothetical protein DPMN_087006 [Dreissena polymorpha]
MELLMNKRDGNLYSTKNTSKSTIRWRGCGRIEDTPRKFRRKIVAYHLQNRYKTAVDNVREKHTVDQWVLHLLLDGCALRDYEQFRLSSLEHSFTTLSSLTIHLNYVVRSPPTYQQLPCLLHMYTCITSKCRIFQGLQDCPSHRQS